MDRSAAPPAPTRTHPTPRLEVDEEGIAQVIFEDSGRSANVLSEPVMLRIAEIAAELREGAAAGRVRGALFRSAKPDTFIVGADVEAIAAIESPAEGAEAARLGQAVFLEVERLDIPTLAVIHGPCLGGGTELALACRYRIASDHPRTKIGLPEVQLGILPAWGGTTRLPRLVGLQAALDLLLTGKNAEPRKALRIGLVEEVVPASILEDDAIHFLRKRIVEGPRPSGAQRSIGTRLLEDTAPGRRIIMASAKRKILTSSGGHYPAPLRILDVVKASFGRPVEKALQLEAEAAGELLASRISKNLVHIFHLREAARKGTGVSSEISPLEVSRIGIVGAGVMGGGIAHLAASKGVDVRIRDLRHDAIAQALGHARSLYDKGVDRKKLSRREADRAMERISGGTGWSGFGRIDLAVEAVVERLDVKRTVLREIEDEAAPDAVLATNTSTLSIDAMAGALDRPENFCGMHFFNPVHRMPLIEIIRGRESSDYAVATVYQLALDLGKVPVVVADGPGFLVNRILAPYMNEAGHLLDEGARADDVDRAATRFGLPMGPLRLVDEVGVDVARHAGEVLHEAFGDRMRPAHALVALGETDRLGRKGGRGIYLYERGKEKGVDPEIYALLGSAARSGSTSVPEAEIRARLILVMINEAARTLEDEIVKTAAAVDLAMIMGTGFPPFRGGLLRFADEIHPRSLVERLDGYAATLGSRFEASPLLRRLAREDRGFYDAFSGEPS